MLVSITLNQFQAPNELLFDFYCKHGSVRFVAPDERYGVLRHGEEDWTWQEVPKLEIDDFFRRQARRFLDVCAGKASVRCTIDDAEHTLKICLAALEANGPSGRSSSSSADRQIDRWPVSEAYRTMPIPGWATWLCGPGFN